MEAQRFDFLQQRPGQTFDGKLGRIVKSQRRRGTQPGEGGDIDDAAGAPPAHARQHRLNHPAEAEHINLEHPAHFALLAFFDGREIADARVIHEHVNAAKPFRGRFDGRVNLALIGDIKFEDQSVAMGRQRFHRLRFARRDDRAKTPRQRLGGQFASEAG